VLGIALDGVGRVLVSRQPQRVGRSGSDVSDLAQNQFHGGVAPMTLDDLAAVYEA
jgi:hypothetical protein